MRKRFRRNYRRAIAALCNLETLESRTLLSAVSWINAYSGNWNTAANWSTGSVPTAADDVFIGQPGFIQVSLDTTTTVHSLAITGDSLQITGGSLAVATSVNNNGSIILNYGNHLSVTGAITQQAGSVLTLSTGSGAAVSAGAISNAGKITVGSGDSVTVSGNFQQASNGDVNIELGGSPASNQFGKFAIGGIATLLGKLEANLVSGYSPGVGDQFVPITFAAESGAFTTFGLPSNSWYAFQPDINAANVVFTALSPGAPTSTIKVAAVVGAVNPALVGVNLGWWDPDLTTPQTEQLVEAAGLNIFRIPGGSSSDDYHFNNPHNYRSDETTIPQYAEFIQAVGGKGLVTMDYGSGSPQEAEAELAYLSGSASDNTIIGNGIEWSDALSQWQTVNWQSVSYWASLRQAAPLAVDDGLNFMRIGHAAFTNFNLWEVGNEVYGGWEIDHHGTNMPDGTSTGSSHDPATYVQFANTFSQFVAADVGNFPPVSIGIDSWDPAGVFDNNWTRRVLTDARDVGFVPGFISDHSYMQSPFSESDNFLLNDSAADPASQYDWVTRYGNYETLLEQTLGAKAAAGVQLMATEYNSDITNPGKQLSSLVNGLFLADAMGSLLNSGYVAGMVWDLRDFWNTTGNQSGSLYGWRQGGDYGLLGDSNYTNLPSTGAYVQYPSYFAQQLSSYVAQAGGQVVSSVSSNGQFSSYAVLQADGHLTLLVINKSPSAAINEQFNISGFTPGSQATIHQYGMTQDTAQSQTTDGASSLANFTAALNVTGNNFSYSFPAYSMTVIDLSPAANPAPPTVATPASAPAIVSGSTAALSVLGAYAAGESNLTYTWAATSFPVGAALPTFSENGTNHSKNAIATFYAAGKYTFTVTLRAPGGAAAISTINVTVNQTLTTISVTAPQPNLGNAATLQFSAQAFDQFSNKLLITPAFIWSLANSGPGGSINSAGLYTSPQNTTGTAAILATSGAIQGSTSINIVAGPVNTIDFSNGFAGADSSLILDGAATVRGSNLLMIDDSLFQAAAAYSATQQNITTFSTQFNFHLDNAWPMGNGFTFIIQNSSPLALGDTGDALGYAGIQNSIAIKFDMYHTSSGNGSTGLFLNGTYPNTSGIELGQQGFNLRSWDPSQATITYDGTTLKVVLTDLYHPNLTDTQTYTVNIPGIVGGSTAYVGFTASSSVLTTAQSISSWTFTNTLTSVAATPTGLTAAPGNGQAALAWIPSVGATSYNISQATSSAGPYTTIATGITTSSYTAINLTNGQSYSFEVSAVASGLASLPSSPATTTPVAPPVAPATLTSTFGNQQVALAWSASTGATSYSIAKSTTNGGPYTTFATNITTLTYTATSLTNGTPYYFVVYAVGPGGTSVASPQTAATPAAVPTTPGSFTATAGNALVALSWSASTGATSYTVKYGTASGNYTSTLANITGTTTNISPLNNGTLYYFIVYAVNAAGNSGNSAEVSATPSNAPPPVIRFIDDGDAGFAKVGTWGSTIEPGRYYGNDHSFAIGGNGADVATYTFTGLTPGVYRVSATWRGDTNRNTATPFTIADGATQVGLITINQQLQPSSLTDQGFAWGDLGIFTITGTTMVVTIRDNAAQLYVDADAIRIERTGDVPVPTAPPIPTNFTPAAGNTQVAFSWTASPGATSYTIKYGTTSGAPYAFFMANITGTSATIANLTNGTKYYFIILASNTIGDSLPSAEVSSTPVAAPPPPVIRYVDDGDAGFSKVGNWGSTVEQGVYYGNDHSFAIGGNGADVATYTFSGITPGVYRVSATWRGDTNRNTATPFAIYDGTTLAATATINQQLQPASLVDQNFHWGDLATAVSITGTTIRVTIKDTSVSLYVDADAIRIERVGDLGFTPPPPDPVYYVDDRGTGWSAVGTWGNSYEPGFYFGNGHSFAIGGGGKDVASFTFTGLAPGLYRVSATWRGDTNRATNAPFTILDGSTPLTTVIVNQQLAPTGLTDAGSNWFDLAGSIRITSTTLVVTLSDNANLYVDADAIRIERIGN